MTWMKQIKPGEKVGLNLTPTDRDVIFDLTQVEPSILKAIAKTPEKQKAVELTLDDWDALAGSVAADANHTEDAKQQRKLDAIFRKIERLLNTYTDQQAEQAPALGVKLPSGLAKLLTDQPGSKQSVTLQMTPKKKKAMGLKLTAPQRRSLIHCTRLKRAIKNRLKQAGEGTQIIEFNHKELDHIQDEVGQVAFGAPDQDRKRLQSVLKKITDAFDQENFFAFDVKLPKKGPKPKNKGLFQFKITLLESKPPIWRRIQVQNCTLDKFHEHIQTAMGWENAHLHHFEIGGKRFGDPELLEDMDDIEFENSTTTRLSEILPAGGKSFRFQYEYDYGDGWLHEVLFEGCPETEKGTKYPVCLEGKRACPLEDVGGVWGYAEFLQAVADPKHESHQDFMEWIDDDFDPDAFDPVEATKRMKTGLPKWKD